MFSQTLAGGLFRINFTAGSILVICFMCSDQENYKQRASKSAVGPKRKAGSTGSAEAARPARRGPSRAARASQGVETKSTAEEETYRVGHLAASVFID